SLGIDLVTAVDITLIDAKPLRIPTSINSPLHESQYQIGALLMGRSSSSLKGIIVIPGLIDADFTGEIQIVTHTMHPPLHIPKGSKIAQLVPLQNFTSQACKIPLKEVGVREDASFGSTGEIICLTLHMHNRPEQRVTMTNGSKTITFTALLDAGADIIIVS
ncbi:POK9 protein, partial [Cardinalis cardinalis]|nr:POK9 protein [Cardinalis cardinalis]